MTPLPTLRLGLLAAALAALVAGPASAAEGMWTLDNFPAAKAKAELGVDIDAAWLGRVQAAEGVWTLAISRAARARAGRGVAIDAAWLGRVQAAAARLRGCSASLVSGGGLVMPNRHCVAGCVQNFSTAKLDYVIKGFL